MERRLDLATEEYPQNKKSGLMICGINWGGSPDDNDEKSERKSFFSDNTVNNYPYRRRLVSWFDFWGHPLKGAEKDAGDFEKSIAQMNWLPDQSSSMNGRDVVKECSSNYGHFELHVKELRPKLIIFCSVNLLYALNNLLQCEEWFGKKLGRIDIRQKEGPGRRYRFGFQNFEKVSIIALPHPSRASAKDEYVKLFHDDINPVISRYKQQRGFI